VLTNEVQYRVATLRMQSSPGCARRLRACVRRTVSRATPRSDPAPIITNGQPRRHLFGGAPRPVDASSSAPDKLAFFRHLRDDVYALRWERSNGPFGWMPGSEGVRGGQQSPMYLPLIHDVATPI
jgi:hypothetical protein